MEKIEKVIYSLERCTCHVPDACRDCAYDDKPAPECWLTLERDALELLKEQQLSDQDRIDLDVIHRIRSRETVKVAKHDYIIVNGDWYRENGGMRVFPMLSEEALKEMLAPEQPKEEDE